MTARLDVEAAREELRKWRSTRFCDAIETLVRAVLAEALSVEIGEPSNAVVLYPAPAHVGALDGQPKPAPPAAGEVLPNVNEPALWNAIHKWSIASDHDECQRAAVAIDREIAALAQRSYERGRKDEATDHNVWNSRP